MIYDHIDNRKYYNFNKTINELLDSINHYYENNYNALERFTQFGISYNKNVFLTRSFNECFFESHKHFVDIHFVLSGHESIAISINCNFITEHPYNEEKDLTLFKPKNAMFRTEDLGTIATLSPGNFLICFPHDIHMPAISFNQPEEVKKIVIKVPVGFFNNGL